MRRETQDGPEKHEMSQQKKKRKKHTNENGREALQLEQNQKRDQT